MIGVAADSFGGLESDGTIDLVAPFALMRATGDNPSRPARSADVVGRLAPGVSIGTARAEVAALWPSMQSATLPTTLPGPEREALLRQRVDVTPLASGFSALRTRFGTTLGMLLGMMGVLLTVACANLAGLALARSLTRRHQVAIRLALGGSPLRVFWQLLIDGILLSAVAFAAAFPLAWAIVQWVRATLMAGLLLSKFAVVTPDAGVLAATALLTVLIGLATGVVSAWRSVAARVDEGLRTAPASAPPLGRPSTMPFRRSTAPALAAWTPLRGAVHPRCRPEATRSNALLDRSRKNHELMNGETNGRSTLRSSSVK